MSTQAKDTQPTVATTKATIGDGNITLPGEKPLEGPNEGLPPNKPVIEPFKLHHMAFTVGKHTIQAHHVKWGLPPLYSFNEIRRATPGAAYEVDDLQQHLVYDPSLKTSDLHGIAHALLFLTGRMRALGDLEQFAFLKEVCPWFDKQAEENRKAVREAIADVGNLPWSMVSKYVAQAATYTGPVRRPCWEDN
ncbi:hypothetical protein I9018_13900 [Pseudomonas sp. MPFS]|uniref:hypothetical protein n=1 Tax=Pseudomonas sp. MPFS TaxID=2795724 RepID=UPI001F137165|nr:hypothetical protein [Pseudomonas sp. MPFS]UMZ14717.1 hypothetical protein I9018_13900 [Pseudomonas sp. MPFS]